ncbi:MAG: hypothetical protein OHM56_12550 [Spiroplasma phoeniceum]|nr:MAG: hypothetical protein OHM56_12550 [Spiroplasma phoeniceum]
MTAAGIPTIESCLIARNFHTISGIIDLDNFNETIKLVTTIIEDLDETKIKEFNWSSKEQKWEQKQLVYFIIKALMF